MEFKLIQLATLVVCVSQARAAALSSLACNNTVFINRKYYVADKLADVDGIPADIAVNFASGDVYFTLISNEMKMSLYRLKNNKELERINVKNLGQSTCVDNVNNVVYLATDNGVYKYDPHTATAQLHSALGNDVMYLATSENGRTIYIAVWPQNRVFKLTGRRTESFKPIANGHGLTIDNKNNIYYEAVKTPYLLKNGENISIKLNGFKPDSMVDFFVTKDEKVYAMDEQSTLYSVDADNALATGLGSFGIDNVNTFGVDAAGNVLVGVKKAIWKWVPHNENPCS